MAKVQMKSDRITPFGGIFSVMEMVDTMLSPTIDATLGDRCKSYGYRYSEIVRSLMSVYFCGGSCVEDVTSHLMPHLSLHPTLRTCSGDTILRAMEELAEEDVAYTSDAGKSYRFNTDGRLNALLVNALLATGGLKLGETCDLDFDHQFLKAEKYDAKPTYKHFPGYRPGVAAIGNLIVGIENSDGNANVRFCQQGTLHRIFTRLEDTGVRIGRFRADCGSCSEEIVSEVERHFLHFYIRASRCESLYGSIFALRGWKEAEINGAGYGLNSILTEKWKGKAHRLVIQRQRRTSGETDLWKGEYTYRCIPTNDFVSSERDIVEFYNQRGGEERILDDLGNGFGWRRLPKSFMGENTVFLILTTFIRNFYKAVVQRLGRKRTGMKESCLKAFGPEATSRIKAFVFRFVTVPAKWTRTLRRNVLNVYSKNRAYVNAFAMADG